MSKIPIKIINTSSNPLPEYAFPGDAGCDLRSAMDVVLLPHEYLIVKTGLHMEIPEGWEIQIRPRSGMAIKHGVTVLNTPGTIDAQYRGEIGVILVNHSRFPFNISKGDRIAQAVLAPVYQAQFYEAKELSNTERGTGGFGHTGN